MRSWIVAAPLLAVLPAPACYTSMSEEPDGCDPTAVSPDCPPGWFCRADRRCYSAAEDGGGEVDADVDARPDEVGEGGEGGERDEGGSEAGDEAPGCVPEECDDGIVCNGVEVCTVDGACVPTPPPDECETTFGAPGICDEGRCRPCNRAACGNGVVDSGEECDDGNRISGDGCDPPCCWFGCAYNLECQDGNFCNGAELCRDHACVAGTPVDGAVCERDGDPGTRDICVWGTCQLSRCGDTVMDPVLGEECDDGNHVDWDACHNDCTWACTIDAECDDGEVCNGIEACDLVIHECSVESPPLETGSPCVTPGGAAGVCRYSTCLPTEGCGNGALDVGEECDDGNIFNGDGCDTDCMFSCHRAADCREGLDNPCTTDTCEVVPGGMDCVHTPNRDPCDDGDPCTLPDVCDGAGGCRGTPIDADGDTYGPGADCGGDCDDGTAAMHPGATEVCNARDDDCDGAVDQGAGCP